MNARERWAALPAGAREAVTSAIACAPSPREEINKTPDGEKVGTTVTRDTFLRDLELALEVLEEAAR